MRRAGFLGAKRFAVMRGSQRRVSPVYLGDESAPRLDKNLGRHFLTSLAGTVQLLNGQAFLLIQ